MPSPILPLVLTIIDDRIREAEKARLARSVATEQPQPAQRPRRIRTLAARLVFSRRATGAGDELGAG
jgi:hypothetical protein